MKLKYERFEGVGCFYVRGNPLNVADFRVLTIGLDAMVKTLDETLLINLSASTLAPDELNALVQIKKALATVTKQKIHWVYKDKALGDFATVELFVSRLSGSKFRQIGERIKLDDQLYLLSEQLKALEEKVGEIGGNDQNAQKLILENKVLKEQARTLDESVHWQKARIDLQEAQVSEDVDLPQKTTDILTELKKVFPDGVEQL